MSKQVDWIAIRAEYENGVPFRMLANKYDVSKTYIIEKRNKENWNRPTKPDRPSEMQSVQNPPKRDVNATNRVALALELRAKKLTYQEIANQCGYGSAGAAYKAIQRELDRVVVEKVEALRKEECYMLDKGHMECWELFMDKNNKNRLFAYDRVLETSRDRRKMLGIDVKPEEAIGPQFIIREVPAGFLPQPIVEDAQ
jgi:hypothetical protein